MSEAMRQQTPEVDYWDEPSVDAEGWMDDSDDPDEELANPQAAWEGVDRDMRNRMFLADPDEINPERMSPYAIECIVTQSHLYPPKLYAAALRQIDAGGDSLPAGYRVPWQEEQRHAADVERYLADRDRNGDTL
jgi:hypothetical protein